MQDFRLLIDGRLVAGARTIGVENPATGQVFVECPRSDPGQADTAVAAAKAAFSAWSRTPIDRRCDLVNRLADALEADQEAFARLITLEQGKPLWLAAGEVAQSVALLRTFAGMKLSVASLRESPGQRIVQHRGPLGVVAAITPWNFPLSLLMFKVAPALVAGNTLVVKPAPTTPLSTLKFGELCAEILPPGVLNTIVDANDLGGLLTSHPDVAKVAFTGSTATGRKVMQSAAPTLKRLTLELGGNDAAIVLDDVDPKVAATNLFQGAMINSGQVCLAIKRAYVPNALYDNVCEELVSLAGAAVVDDGLKQGVQIGPVQNAAQYGKLKSLLEETRAEGDVIAGGAALDRPGYFIAPTIVRDVDDRARIVREEQFGPILPVLSYADLDDAISRANDSEFGLSATVWGADMDRAYAVAQQLEVGTVWVNKHLDLPFDLPFRGAKQSGIGVELGLEGLQEYTQAKVINMASAA